MHGFLRYAAADVLRNRRRTLAAIVGVLLTVTFVAGTFIAIDSSTRATLDAYLASAPGDFSYSAQFDNASRVRSAVAAVPGATDASVYSYLRLSEIGSSATERSVNTSIQGIDPDHLPFTLRGRDFAGSVTLPRGTVGLSADLAAILNVALDDPVYLVYRTFNSTTNQEESRRLNLTVAALLPTPSSAFRGPSGPFFYGGQAVIHLRDLDWVETQLGVEYGPIGVRTLDGEVWIDRERFLDVYNLDASLRNLARLQRQIDNALAPFRGVSSSNLVFLLQNFQQALVFQRIQYLFLSGPLIFLGLYLGAIGVDLGHAERRREFAIFKTRGATPRHVFVLLALEGVFGGAVAGVLGLLAGIGISRLLIGVVTPAVTSPRYSDFLLSADTIVTTVILGAVFMLISSIRSARRTARLPPVESLRYFAPGETRIDYKPTADIILISLAVTAIAVVWWTRSGEANVLVFLLGIIFFLLLPLSPIFLVIGLTRVATRSTGRVYEWASRAVRPLAKNLYHVINRNIARNPRRSSNICVIIALGVAFSLFTLTLLGSQQVWDEARIRASIGADLQASADPQDSGFAANLSAVPGIVGVSKLVSLVGYVSPRFCCAEVWAVDPSTLFAVSRAEPWYFVDGDASAPAAALGTSGSVLATKAYVESAFLEVGDTLVLSGSRFNETTRSWDEISINVAIGGVVRSLPGINDPYRYGFSLPSAVFGTAVTLAPFLVTTRGYPLGVPHDTAPVSEARYLAALAPGADWRHVKDDVTALGAFNVLAFGEELERFNQEPSRRAIYGFLAIEIAFAAVILTVGLTLVTFAAVLERNVEFAGIVARGASGRQAAALLIGEAISILIIGLIVGAGVGLLSSWIMTQIFLVGPPGQVELLVPFLFVLPASGALFILAAPLAMVGAVSLVAWRIARMNVGRALRVRGG